MASKFLFVHMLLALAMLTIQLDAGGRLPTLHFINAANGPINLEIKADGIVRGSVQLSPGQVYRITVKVDDVYFASAELGTSKFMAFHAFESQRDKSYNAVYWKADNEGFAISYDKTTWNMVAPWESE